MNEIVVAGAGGAQSRACAGNKPVGEGASLFASLY